MKKIIKAGSVDQTIDVFIQDSASTTGAGKTGLAYNTASLVCYYRKGATGSATALTLATQTVGGAHSDGGFVEISSANMPGMYRLDLSDTIVATAGTVTLMLSGASGMAPLPIELQVVAVDLEDATSMGISRLDAAVTSRLASASYTAPLDAAGTRTAVGLASANLDTQLAPLASGVPVASIAANAINAAAIATGALTATKFAAGAIDAAALATDAANEIAAAVGGRTMAELSGDPGATPTADQAAMLTFMAIRNKRDTDSGLGTDEIHNSAGTVILTATISDAAGVFSKAKYA